MNKKLISLVLTAVMLFLIFPTLSVQAAPTVQVTSAANAAPTLKIGDYIQMGKYYDQPILWRCVDIDTNGPLLLSDKVLTYKAFDASGEHKYLDRTPQADNYMEDRTYFGSNLWETSSLRSWLNSLAPKGKIF